MDKKTRMCEMKLKMETRLKIGNKNKPGQEAKIRKAKRVWDSTHGEKKQASRTAWVQAGSGQWNWNVAAKGSLDRAP